MMTLASLRLVHVLVVSLMLGQDLSSQLLFAFMDIRIELISVLTD